jgi:hypothetical protein
MARYLLSLSRLCKYALDGTTGMRACEHALLAVAGIAGGGAVAQ